MKKMTGFETINPEELNRLMQGEDPPLLLDVLPEGRYQQVHLPQAVNARVFEVTFLQQVAALTDDKNRPLALYGADAETRDAVTAAEKLLRDGYAKVAVLDGGLEAWRSAGFPVAGEESSDQQPEASISDGTYAVDLQETVIEWAGRNPTTTHRGLLKLRSGEIQVTGGDISGQFVIDMNSIENLNLAGDELQPVLEEHLKSDDFFFVKRFPEARFDMTAKPLDRRQPVSAPNYSVSGTLQLCGVSASQEFSATIVPTDDGKLRAVAHFDFDRTRWGVIYGSSRFFKYLGMHLVFDLISLQLRVVTRLPERNES